MSIEKNHFTQNDYEIINREVLYEGVYRYARYLFRIRHYDGEWSQPFSREILERSSVVGILPYDPILDKVILIEQFRPGAIANPSSPWLLEIVAGFIEANEKPENVAKREAHEESGCEILDIYPVCEYFVTPGISTENIKIFVGCVDASQAGGVFGLEGENENIRAFSLPMEDALKLIQEGKIKTAPAIISLQWLQLNREWLKQLWQKK